MLSGVPARRDNSKAKEAHPQITQIFADCRVYATAPETDKLKVLDVS
jgi:hypothetical protein